MGKEFEGSFEAKPKVEKVLRSAGFKDVYSLLNAWAVCLCAHLWILYLNYLNNQLGNVWAPIPVWADSWTPLKILMWLNLRWGPCLTFWMTTKLFQSGYTILLPHQQYRRVPISSHPHQHLLFSFLFFFLTTAILVGARLYFIMVLVCFSIMTNDEHLFMSICIFFQSLSLFFIWVICLLLSC